MICRRPLELIPRQVAAVVRVDARKSHADLTKRCTTETVAGQLGMLTDGTEPLFARYTAVTVDI